MSAPKPYSTIRGLRDASRVITRWLEWEAESLELFHAYGQRFGKGGNNVYMLVLEDALRSRGLTLDQLRADDKRGL